MRLPATGLTLRRWLRWPRRTARMRLTVLYGGLFLLCGASLLAITYFLFERASSTGGASRMGVTPTTGGIGLAPTAQQLQAAAAQRASTEAAQRASDLHQLLVNSCIALGFVALIAIVLGWLVAGRVLQPVRTITATARRISATNLHQRLALEGADEEFKQLGDTLDELFARLEASFEAQRHFVASASHELRTPLTRERTLLQVALGDPSTSKVWQVAGQELLASNREQERLIEALLALASSEGGLECRERVDLAVICNDVLSRPDLDLDRLGLRAETMINSAPLDGDPRLIERLVANLVDNAVGHNLTGGHIRVATGPTDGSAMLSVTNTGPVIPPTDIDRLFQPFQRLDPNRTHHKSGHGLGLSIVRAISDAHGATITARPEPGGGLSVSVTFPAPQTRNGQPGRPHSVSVAGWIHAPRAHAAEPAAMALVEHEDQAETHIQLMDTLACESAKAVGANVARSTKEPRATVPHEGRYRQL